MKIDCYILQSFSFLDELKKNIKEALKAGGLEAETYYYRIRDEKAIELELTGSPTVLLNGKDLDPVGSPGFYWRTYRHESGRLVNVPTVTMLLTAFKQASDNGSKGEMMWQNQLLKSSASKDDPSVKGPGRSLVIKRYILMSCQTGQNWKRCFNTRKVLQEFQSSWKETR